MIAAALSLHGRQAQRKIDCTGLVDGETESRRHDTDNGVGPARDLDSHADYVTPRAQ